MLLGSKEWEFVREWRVYRLPGQWLVLVKDDDHVGLMFMVARLDEGFLRCGCLKWTGPGP